jgi:hypothetical protein
MTRLVRHCGQFIGRPEATACVRVTVMVLESNGYGVRVTVTMLESNDYGFRGSCGTADNSSDIPKPPPKGGGKSVDS